MSPSEAGQIAAEISGRSGLLFEARVASGASRIELWPSEHDPRDTFTVGLTLGWRSVESTFTPGQFAADLIEAMGEAAMENVLTLQETIGAVVRSGVSVEVMANGSLFVPGQLVSAPWRTLTIRLRRGPMPVNDGDRAEDLRALARIGTNMVSLLMVLLPLSAVDDANALALGGYPEGAVETVHVNRYERDRRNRAAAIAIHGSRCHGCNTEMSDSYGPVAVGLIEVHHTIPVSAMGADYRVNPATDLIPLCPNCHAVVHRKHPPLSLEELKATVKRVSD
jgi:5-methylcytosine-specific restriction protein A